jgi:predicted nucleic acid-binding protein
LAFLETGDDQLFTSPQVLREYLVVATRPSDRNGQGLSVPQALANVAAFRQVVDLVFESEETWDKLQELLTVPDPPSGKQIHDANIAATALANGLNTVATFNVQDFATFALALYEGLAAPAAGSPRAERPAS